MRRAMATALWRFLDDPDAPRVRRGAVPAGGRRPGRHRRTHTRRDRSRLATVTRRISLALAIHNHQPVGNFGWVFDEVFEQAYLPMLEALERHPGVRLSLHYTGPLLEWLRAERPEFIEALRALVERGQVEILGGGYLRARARLASRARPRRTSSCGWRDELEASVRAAARAARGWRSASGSRTCPTSLVAGGLCLDDPRRRPFPRGGDPRGGPVGRRTRPRTRASC